MISSQENTCILFPSVRADRWGKEVIRVCQKVLHFWESELVQKLCNFYDVYRPRSSLPTTPFSYVMSDHILFDAHFCSYVTYLL